MTGRAESEMTRSDTTATDSSGISIHHTQPSPPNSTISTNTITSEHHASRHRRPTTSAGRKRKVPDSVTPNACTNCKKARAKCDGVKPACQRCAQRRAPDSCHYEIHAKTAKEQLVREVQRLQRKSEYLEEEKDSLWEKNSWIEQIMRSLKDDGQELEIISRLKRGESHKAIAEWLGRPLVGSDTQAVSPTTEHRINQAIEQYHRKLVDNRDPRFWTNVSTQAELIEHLIKLYFTWIHPVHMLFDQDHFITSFRECLNSYCSAALVNVICAMSCHLLHDTRDDDEATQSGIESLRAEFINESKSLMKYADPEKMTSIQTYAIMFLVEIGCGHGLKANAHLRLAVESLIAKQTSEQSTEAEEVAAWGILTLHTAWSGLTYEKPCAPFSPHANPFETIAVDQDQGRWDMYRQPGESNLENEYPNANDRKSFAVLTAREHAKLFRIIHECILIYSGVRGKVSADSLLGVFERYFAWKDELPPELQSVESQPLPHILFLHIQYHAAIVQLLQPLLHLDHLDQESHRHLLCFVINHAKTGIELLIQYTTIFSNFYLSPLQLFCLVNLSDALVRYGELGDDTVRTVEVCLTTLEEAKIGYPLAGALQKMFRQSLTEYRIPVSDELERMIRASMRLGPEDLLDACTRSTYKQPFAQIIPMMEADAGQGFMDRWQHIAEGRAAELPLEGSPDSESSRKGKRIEVGSLLNV